MVKQLYCIHEMHWKTCSTCSKKSKKQVIDELKAQHKAKGIEFDFQELEEENLDEKDVDYDIEFEEG